MAFIDEHSSLIPLRSESVFYKDHDVPVQIDPSPMILNARELGVIGLAHMGDLVTMLDREHTYPAGTHGLSIGERLSMTSFDYTGVAPDS